MKSIVSKITFKFIIQMRNHDIPTNLGSYEYEIDPNSINTMNECSLPIRWAVHGYKFKSFIHLLKCRLIVLICGGAFIIPISNSRYGFLERTIEIKEEKMMGGDMLNIIFNLLPNLVAASAEGLGAPAGIAEGLSAPAGIACVLVNCNQVIRSVQVEANPNASSRDIYCCGDSIKRN